MGKRPQKDIKTLIINVRVSPMELSTIKKTAREMRMSLSKYVRFSALNYPDIADSVLGAK